jgi:hypothetical protein
MKKLTLLAVIGLSAIALSAQAQFLGFSIGGRCGGVSVGIGGPFCYAPAPAVYAAPAVTYAPPVAYAPAPVYYAPAPVVYAPPAACYGYGPTVVVGGGYRGCWGGYYGRGYYGYHGYHGGYRHR